MDEGETKTCENCKREIPAVNFTIHAVHCARNIRVCPVCKEPVPQAELQDHHDKMHKLSPCKQCGESVCGTDLEDHIRDSCAHTMKSCRFCALDLRRGSLPAHERYCGARTEQCADCGEWVMHKYRQLHLDSNHGFIRLDDDPVPIKRDAKATNVPKPSNFSNRNGLKNINLPIDRQLASTSANPATSAPPQVPSTSRPNVNDSFGANIWQGTSAKIHNATNSNGPLTTRSVTNTTSGPSNLTEMMNALNSGTQNGAIPRTKRSNDQPQVNTSTVVPDKVKKNLWSSRGAVKKRPAPQPPAAPAAPALALPGGSSARDRALRGALLRQHEEDTQRREQNAYNLSVGLPPVLTPAEKIEKLRKMDALQNRESDDQDYKNCLQGRVWRSAEVAPIGHVLGTANGVEPKPQSLGAERRRNDLKNLKPMTPEEFMNRFSELQLSKEPKEERVRDGDRFSQIKSSLRELRRGLNEVTAPYNSSTNNNDSSQNGPRRSPVDVAGAGAEAGAEWQERLPCEFCGAPVPAEDLVQHQTGCRPDLAQLRVPSRNSSAREASRTSMSRNASRNASSRVKSRSGSRSHSPEPVIPCEFCTESLPVYLITEHQERCGREANLLFPD